MIKITRKRIINRIYWKFSRPISKLLFISHSLFYKDPITNKPYTKKLETYNSNFKKSVKLEKHNLQKNKTYESFPPDEDFVREIAFNLHNVLKNKKNSFIHGFLLNSYLRRYVKEVYLDSEDSGTLNILDIGTARGFSSLCLANVLDDFKINGKIFTFDVIPNRESFFWNAPSDVQKGKLSRKELLNKWKNLVENYIVFFSTATFNSLRVVDIPRIDFAFIDGSHNFEDVIYEIKYILQRLNEKSILIFDDYDADLFPGVVKACDYLSSLKLHSNFELIKVQNYRQIAIFTFGDF